MLSGHLHEFPLPDILQLLAGQQKTGRLHLQGGERQVRMDLEHGAVVWVEPGQRSLDERLGLCLARAGALDPADLQRVLKIRRLSRRTLAQLLIDEQAAPAAVVREALALLAAETVYDVLGWEDGEYQFETGVGGQSDAANLPPMSVQGLLMEGMRRLDEWPQLVERIGGLEIVPDRAKLGEDTDDTPQVRSVWERIDGLHSMHDIIERVLLAPLDVLQIVHDLVEAGRVQLTQPRDPTGSYQMDSESIERLDGFGLARLLAQLYAQRWTGLVVAVALDKIERRFWIADGRVTRASSSEPGERMGAILARQGVLEPPVIEALIGQSRDLVLGRELLRRKLVTMEELEQALEEQIRVVMLPLFSAGEMMIAREEGRQTEGELPLADISSAELILTGVHWIPLDRLPPVPEEARLTPNREPRLRFQKARLKPEVAYLLSCMDGRTALQDLALLSPVGEDETRTIVQGLLIAGLVQIGAGSSAAHREPATGRLQNAPSPADDRELAELVARFAEADHYGVLGLPRDADPETVSAAFRKMSKRYHPDHGRTPGQRRVLEILFTRIVEAGRVLRDGALREKYDRKSLVAK